MKNLLINRVDHCNAKILSEAEEYADDPDQNLVWISTPLTIYSFDVSTSQIIQEFQWHEEREGSSIVNLQFLYDSGEICACLSNGSVLLINTEDGTITKTELAPSLSAAAWSPDLSILTASDNYAITFFDRSFELISMCELNTTERGKDEQVTVGWGSKETQFQGSIGKAAREKPVEIDRRAYENDSGKDHINWRADGQIVLISHKTIDSNERIILVFSKEGELMSRLKNEIPIEEYFAVKPVGNYIATLSRFDEVNRKLVFFERNGEKRHEYSIPSSSVDEIVHVSWDISGAGLMIVYKGANNRVELYTVSNYDWTLKYSQEYKEKISCIKWSSEKSLTFSTISTEGNYYRMSFSQKYTCLGSTVCVISTDHLRFTNFARAPIPPPFSEYTLSCEPVTTFAHNDTHLVVIHSNWTVSIYKRYEKQFSLEKNMKISIGNDWCIISSPQLYKDDLVALVNGTKIVRINLLTGACTEFEELPEKPAILGLNSASIIAISLKGMCYKLDDGWNAMYNLPESASYDIKFSQGHTLICTSSNELFLDGQVVASSVRSFLVSDEFCAYITFQNQIFFSDISKNFQTLEKARSVELGSELVTCVPEKMSITMQMPRGNLETIYPRVFVVKSVRQNIQSGNYVDALFVMKKHRINMNILIDLDFETFSSKCAALFSNNSSAELLDLFISSVSNNLSEYCTGKPVENKVEKVTQLIENGILQLDYERRIKFFTVLLSALLKRSPPEAEKALLYIKQHTDQMSPSDREHYSRYWLHHVGFFLGENEMFNAALATYDLELTVQVAETSNRDPKEYLPILNDLRKIEPEQYRRYKIQVLRGDWNKALEELSELPEKIEDALSIIKEKGLHSHALRVFKEKPQFKAIIEIVATHLGTKGNWVEAAKFYQKLDNNTKVIECLEKSKNVRAFMDFIKHQQLPFEQLSQKLKKMAIHLESDGRFREAYDALRFAKVESGQIISLISKGCCWLEAIDYLKVEKTAKEQLETAVRLRLEILHAEISRREADIIRFSDRLEVVRNSKEQKIQRLQEGIESGRDLEDIDAFSEVGSTISNISRRTGKSGSSRASTTATMRKRKQIERKKQSLKEGGEYEDSALLLVLHENYRSIANICVEAKGLLLCLVELDLYQEAHDFQVTLEKLCILARNKHSHIWPSKLQPKHLCGPLQLLYTIDDTFCFPSEGGMPSIITYESEMIPPPIVDVSSWQLVCLQ